MNRGHSAAHYKDIIRRLRTVRPDLALSSDIIVGFPGESEEDFQATMDLVAEVNYAQCYSFKYSPRPGTPAAEMGDQVDEDVKSKRLQRLQNLLNAQQLDFNEAMIGRTLEVIVERRGKTAGQFVGRSPYMQAVHFTLDAADQKAMDEAHGSAYHSPIGATVSIKINRAGPNSLSGEIVAVA